MTLRDYPGCPVGSARPRPCIRGILARAFLRVFSLSMPKRRCDRHNLALASCQRPLAAFLMDLGLVDGLMVSGLTDGLSAGIVFVAGTTISVFAECRQL